MDTDQAFMEIRKDISDGRGDLVGAKTLALAESDTDPMTRIKCLSLLKVVEDRETSQAILGMIMDALPEDPKVLVQTAGALRGLDYPSSALSILKGMEQDDSMVRMSVLCLMDLEEYEEALDFFYKSDTYKLISQGIADMHCRSDEYLADELLLEWQHRLKQE